MGASSPNQLTPTPLSSTHRPASSRSPASSLNPSPSSTHNQGLFTRLGSEAGSPVYNPCHPAPWSGLPDSPLTPPPALTGAPSPLSREAFAHLAPSARHALPATSQDRLLAGGTSPFTKPLRSAQHSFSASCFFHSTHHNSSGFCVYCQSLSALDHRFSSRVGVGEKEFVPQETSGNVWRHFGSSLGGWGR